MLTGQEISPGAGRREDSRPTQKAPVETLTGMSSGQVLAGPEIARVPAGARAGRWTPRVPVRALTPTLTKLEQALTYPTAFPTPAGTRVASSAGSKGSTGRPIRRSAAGHSSPRFSTSAVRPVALLSTYRLVAQSERDSP